MTAKEALKVIDKVHDYPCPYGIGGTVWLFIRNCIEKQIPKKPIVDPTNHLCDFQNFRCPKCNKKIISRVDGEWIAGSLQGYCDDCGQRLDWSDKE